MKTPDEIKKGLEYCSLTDVAKIVKYAKRGIPYACVEDLIADALAYIQQLEAENAELQEKIDYWSLEFAKETRKTAEKNLKLLRILRKYTEKIPKWNPVEKLPKESGAYIVWMKTLDGKAERTWDVYHVDSGWCGGISGEAEIMWWMSFDDLPIIMEDE